ncbi:MAG: hypothetical protein GX183_00765 [Firmicutes bacterium]|nr:hypothetical protein [Bacillota bacterium]
MQAPRHSPALALRLLGRSLALAYEHLGMSLLVSVVWFFAAATAASLAVLMPAMVALPLTILAVAPVQTAAAYWANLTVHQEDAGIIVLIQGLAKFFLRALLLGAMHGLAAFLCAASIYMALAAEPFGIKVLGGLWVYASVFVGLTFMYAYAVMVEQDTTVWKAVRRSMLLVLDNPAFTAAVGLLATALLAAGVVPTVLMLAGVQGAGAFSVIGVMAYAGVSSIFRNLATVRLLQRYGAARASQREILQRELEEERMARLERTEITWHGHSCFTLVMENGLRVVTDPFDESIGLSVPALVADVVTISHDHFDHNNADAVKGSPEVLRGRVDRVIGGVRFRSVESSHDEADGAKRGSNDMFVIETDDFRVCHMGDLGEVLSDRQVMALGNVDVLLIPVGGYYTIDAEQAWRVVERVRPRAVIPMHYRTDGLKLNVSTADSFVGKFNRVQRMEGATWAVRRADLPAPERAEDALVVVLERG